MNDRKPPKTGGVRSLAIAPYLETVASTHYAGSKSESTARSILKGLAVFFGPSKPLSSIDTPAIARYVDHLKAIGNQPSSIARKLAVLQKALGLAVLDDLLPRAPRIPKQRSSILGRSRPPRYLQDPEVLSLTDFLRKSYPDYLPLTDFLLETGVRLGEALGLEWEDVRDRIIDLWDTKNGGSRSVPLTPKAFEVLESLRSKPGGPFHHLTDYTYHRVWNKAKASIGLADDKQFVPHVLRHTFASRLVQRGASLQVVQKLLGHSKLEMTLVYAHLSPANLAEAVALLG